MNPFLKAKRIWSAPREDVNQYALFLERFSLKRIPKKAMLRIRADHRYSLTLNGEWIPAQQYSDYDFAPVYDEIDLDPSVFCIGENTISILAYCQNESSFSYRLGEPSLIYEMIVDGAIVAYSGAHTLATLDTGYESGVVEKFTSQLLYSFRYHVQKAENPIFQKAEVLAEREMKYSKRPIPQLLVSEPISCKLISQGVFQSSQKETSGERIYYDLLSARRFIDIGHGEKTLPSEHGITLSCEDEDGLYAIVDLERESVGYFLLDIEVSEDCRIDCGFGEHLEDLRVRSLLKGRNFAFTIYAVKGRNRVFWPIKRLGCRYFQLHAACGEVKLYYLGMRSVDYPFASLRIPRGLNSIQQKIYEVAAQTLRLCAHEHYEDCPWREQGLYAMDSRNQMLFSYDAFGELQLPKESLRLLAQGQKNYGLLELCAPASAPDRVNIPCFSLVWITALEEYFQKSKDQTFVLEMLPTAKRILQFFDDYESENGLIRTPVGYWNFYEWNPLLNGEGSPEQKQARDRGIDAPLNAFYLMALSAFERLLACVGKMQETNAIKKRTAKIKKGYQEVFYSEKRQAYRLSTVEECREVYPELVQSLSIVAGLCPTDEIQKSLVMRLADGEFAPFVTLSHRIYYYQALMTEPSLRNRILEDVEAHWMPMLLKGATSFWETEKGADDFKGAGSLCHGWSAAPIWVYWQCFRA